MKIYFGLVGGQIIEMSRKNNKGGQNDPFYYFVFIYTRCSILNALHEYLKNYISQKKKKLTKVIGYQMPVIRVPLNDDFGFYLKFHSWSLYGST